MPLTTNLLHSLFNDLTDEVFTKLPQQDAVRIERIVSNGHVFPANF